LTVSGVISGAKGLAGSGVVTIEGAGTTTFSASNTYAGGTILKSGKLQISADNRLGQFPADVAGNTTAGINNGYYNNVTFDGGTLRTSAAVTMNVNRGFYIKSTGGTLEAGSGAVSSAGEWTAEGNFTKTGSGNLTLSALYLLNADNLNVTSNAATLTLSGTVAGANRNVNFNGSSTTTLSGTADLGTGTLNKSGGGTMNITSAANNIMGAASITAGRLNASNTVGSAFGSGNVTVSGTGTLGGVGAFTGSATINAGGKIDPGAANTVGVLGTGALAFNGGAYAAQLNSSAALASALDVINANGGLSIAGGSTLTLADIGTSTLLPANTKLTLASYSGAWDGGTFAGLPDDTGTISTGLNTFTINYNDTSGGPNGGAYTNFVTLTTPASVAGDWNGNGKVNLADYVTWRKDEANFGGTEGSNPSGYVTWRENFDTTAGSSSSLNGAAVPEPSSIALVLLGFAALAGRRRSR
jgi:autotransporter-associated beta strand protein